MAAARTTTRKPTLDGALAVLKKLAGTPAWAERPEDPLLDHLLVAVLGWHVDADSARAGVRALSRVFLDMNEARSSPLSELGEVLKPHVPAEKLRQVCWDVRMALQDVWDGVHSLDLEPLRGSDPEDARAYLKSLPNTPGGPAALLFQIALGKEHLALGPRERHLLSRLGLLPRANSAQRIRAAMEKKIKRDDRYLFAWVAGATAHLYESDWDPKHPFCKLLVDMKAKEVAERDRQRKKDEQRRKADEKKRLLEEARRLKKEEADRLKRERDAEKRRQLEERKAAAAAKKKAAAEMAAAKKAEAARKKAEAKKAAEASRKKADVEKKAAAKKAEPPRAAGQEGRVGQEGGGGQEEGRREEEGSASEEDRREEDLLEEEEDGAQEEGGQEVPREEVAGEAGEDFLEEEGRREEGPQEADLHEEGRLAPVSLPRCRRSGAASSSPAAARGGGRCSTRRASPTTSAPSPTSTRPGPRGAPPRRASDAWPSARSGPWWVTALPAPCSRRTRWWRSRARCSASRAIQPRPGACWRACPVGATACGPAWPSRGGTGSRAGWPARP